MSVLINPTHSNLIDRVFNILGVDHLDRDIPVRFYPCRNDNYRNSYPSKRSLLRGIIAPKIRASLDHVFQYGCRNHCNVLPHCFLPGSQRETSAQQALLQTSLYQAGHLLLLLADGTLLFFLLHPSDLLTCICRFFLTFSPPPAQLNLQNTCHSAIYLWASTHSSSVSK
jgi:hypothetical protein